MNIVILLTDLGQGALKHRFPLPPLLALKAGPPLYRYGVNALPLNVCTHLVFILKKDKVLDILKKDINNTYGVDYPCSIIVLDQKPRGSVEAVLKACHALDKEAPTLVHECRVPLPTTLPWSDLLQADCDGAVVLLPSSKENGCATIDSITNRLICIETNATPSSYALGGIYFFKDTPLLERTLQQVIQKKLRINHQYALATVCSLMLDENKTFIGISEGLKI